MKPILSSLLVIVLAMALVAGALDVPRAQAQEPAAGEETTPPAEAGQDEVFYALGLAVAQTLTQFNLTEEELAQVVKGLEDSVLKREPKVDVREYMPRIQALAQGRQQQTAAVEGQAAQEFLAQKAGEQGAVRTDSGLIYKELTAGTGAMPAASDQVRVHYHGTLRTGEVFDSSVDRGEPVTFPLGQVVPCWVEGLQLMKVGGKSQLVCPAALAYGDRGTPGIPPGSALVFQVELLEIVQPDQPES